jgi:hypothetical protein
MGALCAAAAWALATPALLLLTRATPQVPPAPAAPLLAPVAGVAVAIDRPMFGTQSVAIDDQPLPADAPELVGIAGRIGRDAVALVRGAGGGRTLAVGDAVDGWRLESLAIDAAFFTRGAQRLRVPLPAGESDAAQ